MGAIVYIIFGFIEFLVIFRLIFKFLGANPANGFVAFVYNLSAPLVAPFAGIFGQSPAIDGAVTQGVFEWASLFAIIVFGLVGAVLTRLFAGMGRRHGHV